MSQAESFVPAELLARLALNAASLTREGEVVFGISTTNSAHRRLAVLTDNVATLGDFAGEISEVENRALLVGPLDAANAVALRRHVTWLRPQTLGLQTSAGLGDRLGLATAGQLHALREVGGTIAPIPAQQSIRELDRTGRSPQQVLDDAMWGIFSEGWRTGFGADADHLKTFQDIDRCVAAGYTFYTFDPGAYVDNTADTASEDDLQARCDVLPWEQLADTPKDLARRYVASTVECDGHQITFDESILRRAAAKYGRAIAHVSSLYHHLAQSNSGHTWEVEVSVDETETPTTHAEHIYWARELARLGVKWVSLAPRFIGRFEKGVDYIGDISAFTKDFAVHAAIARTFGPYKLSLHSGSDKFSIYDICAEETHGLIHLKTAGTSYLEALRAVGELDPALLREIYAFACNNYFADRMSYHVSAQLDRAPDPKDYGYEVTFLPDQFDARQILHVTFGSVLTACSASGDSLFRDRILTLLRSHPGVYADILTSHFMRHLQPFAAVSQDGEKFKHDEQSQ